MSKKGKQSDIEFNDKLYSTSKFVNTAIHLQNRVWNIDDKLGKINVLSRINPDTAGQFNLSKKNLEFLRKLSSAKARECKTDGCRYFQRVHSLSDKSAYAIWKKLTKGEQDMYSRFAAMPSSQRFDILKNYRASRELNLY